MDRMKTILIYVLMIIGFYIFSNALIFVGLNTNYDAITSKGEVNRQIDVTRAEATLVNGRIRGTIKNDIENDLNGKYIKVDVFSKRDVLLGTKYLQINNLAQDGEEKFEVFFKAQDAEYYNIDIVSNIPETEQGLFDGIFIDSDMKTYAIIGALIALMFM